MDFFARQEKTRHRTAVLLAYFAAAVAGTAALVYFLVILLGFFLRQQLTSSVAPIREYVWWNPSFFFITFCLTLGVIGIGSLVKIVDLRSGGSRVAERLGGRRIHPNTDDFYERRLLNVVEEMAIAAGMTVPPVYLLSHEKGINAFAAGYTPRDAVVAVTCGTMVGLKREELQGVIAHEFSHILNGDMRLNIHLMGSLHGLLILALVGRTILRARVRGKGAIYVLLTGGALLAIGSIGLFFGKLIKSAISRQREFLADASAVQFTRNPAGLAGALKKIGGLAGGSRLAAPQAEEASHMFFSNGLRRSSLATHPPLKERVRWLEPSFNGTFKPVTHESLYQALAASEGAPARKDARGSFADIYTRPVDLAVTGAVLQNAGRKRPAAVPARRNPDELMATIGAPLQEHVLAAGQLIESIPAELKAQARDPYGVRAVIYLLLLDGGEAVRERQLNALREQADAGVFAELEKLIPFLAELRAETRLPLFDLAMPALKLLTREQYLSFRGNLRPLIDADDRVSGFEYTMQRILICHLDPFFGGKANQKRIADYYAFCGVQRDISCVLSILARLNPEPSTAFKKAAEEIPDIRATFTLLPETECGWEQLDAALDKLARSSFYIKKWVLASALVCLMVDREIVVEEVELFRAIADSLDCPVPPWITVTTLPE